MEPHQEKKLDDLLAGMNQLIPQVSRTQSDVNYLRSSTKRLEIQGARHDERMGNIEGDVDAIGGKVRDHIGQAGLHKTATDTFTDATVRWKFVGTVAAGIVAVIAAIVGIYNFIPGGPTP